MAIVSGEASNMTQVPPLAYGSTPHRQILHCGLCRIERKTLVSIIKKEKSKVPEGEWQKPSSSAV